MAEWVLGIETSCDETSAAVLRHGGVGSELAGLSILSQDVHRIFGGVDETPAGTGTSASRLDRPHLGALVSAVAPSRLSRGLPHSVVLPTRLRDSASMAGDVDVLGQYDHLDVWNHERFLARLTGQPYTDDDARALSEFGV